MFHFDQSNWKFHLVKNVLHQISANYLSFDFFLNKSPTAPCFEDVKYIRVISKLYLSS